MDIEEELELHFIRKVCEEGAAASEIPKSRASEKYKVFDYIPLSLKHVKNLTQESWKERNIISIFNGRVHFRNCLVYSNVLCKTERSEYFVYTVDDGTGTIDVTASRKLKNLNEVLKLEDEVNELQQQKSYLQDRELIVKSLKNLLLETKKQLNNVADIMPGSRILIYGKPSYFRQVSLDAFHILRDDKADRKVEIAFKNELIDWYKKHILLS